MNVVFQRFDFAIHKSLAAQLVVHLPIIFQNENVIIFLQ
jgi:hypothetical protein